MVIGMLNLSSPKATARFLWEKMLYAIMDEPDRLSEVVKEISQEMNMTLKEIAEKAEIPISTLYKLTSTDADPRLSTIRKLVLFLKTQEEIPKNSTSSIGLITSRDVLDKFGNTIEIEGQIFRIREYLANTIEEEIVIGVRAVKEGVQAIVCGPIAANTLKKIVEIPVIGIAFSKESLVEAIRKAHPKI
ncbi:MAG: helix-turn-helix domain-containing protein [Candidatus Heimdallarchaeota archaeon]|nr:helix-turn-helix domain-containing protein [Candidatus Heimdallarchaeota archaeon]